MSDVLPAGTYFLGDPCYAIANDDWSEYLNACSYGFEWTVFEFRGLTGLTGPTSDGDGVYKFGSGEEYCVDSGMLGATPIDLVSDKYSRELLEELGRFVTFENDLVEDHITEAF